jgi:hypothetical protein
MAYNIVGNGYNYLGVTAITPPNLMVNPHAPTINNLNANIGDLWLQQGTTNLWFLSSLADKQATWTPLGGGGGSIVAVNGGANINVSTVAGIATVNLNTSINQPDTSSDATQGVYNLGGFRFLHNYGTRNTFLGKFSGTFNLTGADNTCLGNLSGGRLTNGDQNSCLGSAAGFSLTSANNNTFLGFSSGFNIVSGTDNVIIGNRSGFDLDSNNSSNIIISNNGVTGDQNTIRIGTQGSDPGEQNTTYIAGIYANTVDGGSQQYVIIDNTGKLGSAVGGGGGGSVNTLSGDTGSPASPTGGNIDIAGGLNINTVSGVSTVTANLNTSILLPNTSSDGIQGVIALGSVSPANDYFMHNYGTTNTFLGYNAGNMTLTSASTVAIGNKSGTALSSGLYNTLVGSFSGLSLTTGDTNCFFGWTAGQACTSGSSNCIFGTNALTTTTTASYNSVIGDSSLSILTSGNNNSALGWHCATNLLTGQFNLFLGSSSGINFVSNESSNILLMSSGVAADQNTIRIGTQGSGTAQQNKTYIAGIYNTSIGSTSGVVQIDNTGKLGSSTGTNGQVLIGGGTGPAWANITSADSSVTITNSAHGIDLSTSGGGGPTYPGCKVFYGSNTGGANVPTYYECTLSVASSASGYIVLTVGPTWPAHSYGNYEAEVMGQRLTDNIFRGTGWNGAIVAGLAVNPNVVNLSSTGGTGPQNFLVNYVNGQMSAAYVGDGNPWVFNLKAAFTITTY